MNLDINTPLSEADIADELTSIVFRASDLMKLVTTGPDDTPDAFDVTIRLQCMDRAKEAEEFETLVARAEELRSASSWLR